MQFNFTISQLFKPDEAEVVVLKGSDVKHLSSATYNEFEKYARQTFTYNKHDDQDQKFAKISQIINQMGTASAKVQNTAFSIFLKQKLNLMLGTITTLSDYYIRQIQSITKTKNIPYSGFRTEPVLRIDKSR